VGKPANVTGSCDWNHIIKVRLCAGSVEITKEVGLSELRGI